MRRVILIVLFAGLACGLLSRQAGARAPYLKEFKEKYGAGDEAYANLIEETKCFICHVGKSKKNRNSYGIALSKVVMKNEKQKAKIAEALGKVEEEKSPDGKTFGELIKEHKLPGGPPQKEDPQKE
ncbi:MAG TPA: hypothetical protein VNH11_26240 [Pirellulales bacterium]|nr:hypothetical protein [Pirellulales bacterium]